MQEAYTSYLRQLQSLRGNPAIVYHSDLTGDGVRMLYECLRKLGRTEHLDLILYTAGGSVTRAHQAATLLREHARYLTILVPYRARSAGTLLCLAADEMVLGPMAELGPIDSHIGSAGHTPPDAPGMISAEDVRSFRRMAEEWFGVGREEDRLQVLALVAQRIFPTSLSSFYRYDKLVRHAADQLLVYQMPGTEASRRQRIVDQLVGGYYAHDQVISRAEIRELGLRATDATPEVEALLWNLTQACGARTPESYGGAWGEGALGLVASVDFRAEQAPPQTGGNSQQRRGSYSSDEPDFTPEGVDEESTELTWKMYP